MKIKTAEVTGAALNWLVSVAGGDTPVFHKHLYDPGATIYRGEGFRQNGIDFRPASSPAHSWPIIDLKRITTHCFDGLWVAFIFERNDWGMPKRREEPRSGLFGEYVVKASALGIDALEAAMRCYVISELGDEVEIPDELVVQQ